MSDIAILKEMINEKATVPLQERQDGTHLNYSVTLAENQDKDNYSVTIKGMPKQDEVIIINVDTFFVALRKVFNGSRGECKRADFVIITDSEIEKMIICIEIKKKKDERKTIIKQLTGAKCFVTYCQEIGKDFWHQPNFLDGYEYRFVSIGDIPIAKTKTRPNRRKTNISRTTEIHNSPERMLKISGHDSLQFNYLIEGT